LKVSLSPAELILCLNSFNKNMNKIFFIAACFLLNFANAQTNNTIACSLPEASQFDFWIGDWDLTWNDTLQATNHVEKILGNCTVQENFNSPKTNLLGKSWSVYNVNYKVWQQTWVDNYGGYTDVMGGIQGDSMVLSTPEKNVPKTISPSGKIINRMVYFHITPKSFDWNWESSTDGGKTWKSNWLIHYRRKL
jgi:hypothetical protein